MKAQLDEFVQPARELARRVSGGIEVASHWSPLDDSTTVEVWDAASEETIVFGVPPERALEAFYHPFAQARRVVRRARPGRRGVSARGCTLQAGRRLFPPDGDKISPGSAGRRPATIARMSKQELGEFLKINSGRRSSPEDVGFNDPAAAGVSKD